MFEDIKKSIQQDLDLFELKFQSLIQDDFSLLSEISHHIFKTKGKQIRSLLLLHTFALFADKADAKAKDQALLAASLIEILHAASLIHDDVVDDANTRRSVASVKSIWGNKTAVLAGDYLMSNAFLLAYNSQEKKLFHSLISVIKEMSKGELLQLQYTANKEANKEIYFQIIEAKTAALFACCCEAAAFSMPNSDKNIQLARELGLNLGIAFQIRDDLLDFSISNKEKLIGNDLKEGKITLPILYYLESAPDEDVNQIWDYLQKDDKDEKDEIILDQLIHKIRNSNALELSKQDMMHFTNKALSRLEEIESTQSKKDLESLIKLLSL